MPPRPGPGRDERFIRVLSPPTNASRIEQQGSKEMLQGLRKGSFQRRSNNTYCSSFYLTLSFSFRGRRIFFLREQKKRNEKKKNVPRSFRKNHFWDPTSAPFELAAGQIIKLSSN